MNALKPKSGNDPIYADTTFEELFTCDMLGLNLKDKAYDEYYYEDGRRYNSTIRYILPSDKEESARLLEQHFCFKRLQNGNYLAPVKQQLEAGIQVLDSACGYGASWTIDMAKEYPNSQLFGVDISDGFPSKKLAPVNTNFSTGNICKAIPSLDNTFGFAFQRLVFSALTSDEWNSNLRELYRVLKPGGFVELLEHNMTCYNAGPLLATFTDRITQGFNKAGLVVLISTELNDRLKEAGFIHCVTTTTEYPLNYGEHADANWRTLRGPFRAIRPLLAPLYKEWEDKDEYDRFLDALTKEVAEYKSYLKFYTVYAQKP